VKNLVPKGVRSRLLFVWGQDRCQSVSVSSWKMGLEGVAKTTNVGVGGGGQQQPHEEMGTTPQITRANNGGDRRQRNVIFRKSLSKVWAAYPLWNEQNTLMMDDSPDKCPEKYSGNTLHPPPISGLYASSIEWIRKGNLLLDKGLGGDGSSNTATTDCEERVRSYLDDRNIDRQDAFFRKLVIDWKSTADDDAFLTSYLPKFGTGHMGWRAGSIKKGTICDQSTNE